MRHQHREGHLLLRADSYFIAIALPTQQPGRLAGSQVGPLVVIPSVAIAVGRHAPQPFVCLCYCSWCFCYSRNSSDTRAPPAQLNLRQFPHSSDSQVARTCRKRHVHVAPLATPSKSMGRTGRGGAVAGRGGGASPRPHIPLFCNFSRTRKQSRGQNMMPLVCLSRQGTWGLFPSACGAGATQRRGGTVVPK